MTCAEKFGRIIIIAGRYRKGQLRSDNARNPVAVHIVFYLYVSKVRYIYTSDSQGIAKDCRPSL